jgi:hypothetical protein
VQRAWLAGILTDSVSLFLVCRRDFFFQSASVAAIGIGQQAETHDLYLGSASGSI